MKALIRNKEIYPETQWSPFTINHLAWHRTANPDGDGYALAEDYPEDAKASDFDISQAEHTEGEGEEARTVIYLTATLNTDRYNARIQEGGKEIEIHLD